ncbi:hypothetical protein B566_EDAN004795 [Ephemera danica]|nr:hypothetical protein B566_EDAN004795 [Ephemera danica]
MVDLSISDATIQDLIHRSLAARERAYCPYSKFKVGCALLCRDGSVFEGCNVENISYGLSICAERTAIVSAVAAGHQAFVALAVAAELGDTFVPPCGACRQFIAEFGVEVELFLCL